MAVVTAEKHKAGLVAALENLRTEQRELQGEMQAAEVRYADALAAQETGGKSDVAAAQRELARVRARLDELAHVIPSLVGRLEAEKRAEGERRRQAARERADGLAAQLRDELIPAAEQALEHAMTALAAVGDAQRQYHALHYQAASKHYPRVPELSQEWRRRVVMMRSKHGPQVDPFGGA